MEFKTEFGLCRFCQSEGQHRDIMKEYSVNGKRENYSDIFLECFNIFISISVSQSALICTQCVNNLRAARAFREFVLRAEQRLAAMNTSSIPWQVPVRRNPVAVKLEPILKTEPSDYIDILEHDVIGNVKQESDADSPAVSKPVKRKLKHRVLYPTKLKSGSESLQAQDKPVITKSTKTASPRTLRTFGCVPCGQVFSAPSALSAHRARHHRAGSTAELAAGQLLSVTQNIS